MAQHMRAYLLSNAGVRSQYIDYLPESGPGHGGSPVAQEKVGARFFFVKGRAALFKVSTYVLSGHLTKRYHPFFVSFPQYPYMTTGQATVGHRELYQFRNPYSRSINKIEHCIITKNERGGLRRQSEKLINFRDIQSFGQDVAGFWWINIADRIFCNKLLPGKIVKKSS